MRRRERPRTVHLANGMALFHGLRALLRRERTLIPKRDFSSTGDVVILLGEEIRKEVGRLYGGAALRIRTVDAGSSGAEEIELKALTNGVYDMERFGLRFVSSPRHADMLLVTGPVTRNMVSALKETYDAIPQPCVVVAVGDGACDGGIWNESYAVVGAVEKVIPVHAKIPGDPPSPRMILNGLLTVLKEIRK